MRLRRFRVRGFRCVRDTGDVEVGDLVALVGTNESGKTAILQALELLNVGKGLADHDLCEDMEDETASLGFRVVEGRFDLDRAEREAVKEHLGSRADIAALVIYRTPDEREPQYDFEGATLALSPRKDEPAVAQLEHAAAKASAALRAQPPARPGRSPAAGSAGAVDESGNPEQTGEEADALDPLQETISALDVLAQASNLSADEIESEAECVRQVGFAPGSTQSLLEDVLSAVEAAVREEPNVAAAAEFVRTRLHPKLVYFSEYKKIWGLISLPELLARSESAPQLDSGEPLDRLDTVENLLFLADLDPEELQRLSTSPQQRAYYLQTRSKRLSDALAPTWRTQKVEVSLSYTPPHLEVRVADLHSDGTRTNDGLLLRRGEGFRWHFSFFVNFLAETQRADLEEAILLLDEPGLHLHPAQQTGMVELLRSLSESNQVVYSTHSPFMLLGYERGRILTVERDEQTHLTKVYPSYWDASPETLLPVLQALGGQALLETEGLGGGRYLRPVAIVEGPTDYMYLHVVAEALRASKHLRRRAETCLCKLDLRSSQGSGMIPGLAVFHLKRGYKVAVVLDEGPGTQATVGKLVREGFPEQAIVRLPPKEARGDRHADIEDLFDAEEFMKAVDDCYASRIQGYARPEAAAIVSRAEADFVGRIVPTLEAVWKEHSQTSGWPKFDKRLVCEKLCDLVHSGTLRLSNDTLGRFLAVFEKAAEGAAGKPPGQSAA